MTEQDEHRARRMWRALEPVHAVTYFAPETVEACTALGTKGYWMSYFATRAAALGPVPAPVVTALFHGFHPGLVARSVPHVWSIASPERFAQVRVDATDAALRRLLGDLVDTPEVAEAADLAEEAVRATPTDGRALGAATAALESPTDPHLRLWQAQSALRELRGDGHVAALVLAGLSGIEGIVLFAADLGLDTAKLQKARGWSAGEWAAGTARLTDRGLLTADGTLTEAGRGVRADVEAHTDALADVAWQALGDERCDRLADLVAPLVHRIVEQDGLLRDNPMGLRPRTG